MARILIALSSETLEQTITNHIRPVDQVIRLGEAMAANQAPDICIVDVVSWDETARLVNNYGKLDVRRLLAANMEELQHLPQHIQEHADDIITLPLQPAELYIRLRNLLQMKEQSEQQRRIYEQLAATNKALESTSDAIIIADNVGVSIYVNPAFAELFDYSVNELNVGGIPSVLFETPTLGTHIFNTVRQEGSWKGEVELKTKTGNVIPFLLQVDSIENDQGQPIGFITICTDITQHKRVSIIQEEQRILAEAQLDMAKALTSTLDLTEVFERILDNVSQVVPNDAANIILIQDGKTQLVDRDEYSDTALIEQLKTGEVPAHKYKDLQKILQTSKPLVISNTRQYLNEHHDMQIHTPWLNSHLGIPILLREEIIGFLNVDSVQPGLFTQAHAKRLQLFAEQAAIAIHNASLHERAQKLAMLEERQRLARNLHDAISQTLFSASIIAEALPRLWQTNPDDIPSRLEQIGNLTRGALAEMRSLLLELQPERLLEAEIGQLIHELADGVLGQTQIEVALDVMPDITLPTDIHVAVYYIIQEALNNVARHAEATQVTVQLHKQQDQLALTITDNGRGFDPGHTASTSFGLLNVQQRTQSTNADLHITSEIGEGTKISVNWPLQGNQNV